MKTVEEAVQWIEDVPEDTLPVSRGLMLDAYSICFDEYPDVALSDAQIMESLRYFVDGYRAAQESPD